MDALMTTLTQLSPSERIARLQALANDSEAAAKMAVELIDCVVDADEEIRNWASEALENLEAPLASDAAKIAKQISNPADDAAYWALKLLGRLGEEAKSQEAQIAAALKPERSLTVQQNAAWALGKIGFESSTTRGLLEKAAGSADARLAQLAKQALSGN